MLPEAARDDVVSLGPRGDGALEPPRPSSPFVPGELIVGFKSTVDAEKKREALGRVDAEIRGRLPVPGTQLVSLATEDGVRAAAAELEQLPGVAYAQPNFYRRAEATPNDPQFSTTWGLHNTGQTVNGVAGTSDADIDAPEAWNVQTGSSEGAVVAVLDTGAATGTPIFRRTSGKTQVRPRTDSTTMATAGLMMFAAGTSSPPTTTPRTSTGTARMSRGRSGPSATMALGSPAWPGTSP